MLQQWKSFYMEKVYGKVSPQKAGRPGQKLPADRLCPTSILKVDPDFYPTPNPTQTPTLWWARDRQGRSRGSAAYNGGLIKEQKKTGGRKIGLDQSDQRPAGISCQPILHLGRDTITYVYNTALFVNIRNGSWVIINAKTVLTFPNRAAFQRSAFFFNKWVPRNKAKYVLLILFSYPDSRRNMPHLGG